MMWLLYAKDAFLRVFKCAAAYPLQVALIVAVAASVWLWAGKQDALADLSKERAAHIATKVGYANAQKAAAEINKARVAHIKREYEIAGQKAEAEYEKLIVSNRANLSKWLRKQAAKGNAGSAGTSEAAPMPAETLPDAETAIVPISDLGIVADAYAQLDALRAWALEVGKVK